MKNNKKLEECSLAELMERFQQALIHQLPESILIKNFIIRNFGKLPNSQYEEAMAEIEKEPGYNPITKSRLRNAKKCALRVIQALENLSFINSIKEIKDKIGPIIEEHERKDSYSSIP